MAVHSPPRLVLGKWLHGELGCVGDGGARHRWRPHLRVGWRVLLHFTLPRPAFAVRLTLHAGEGTWLGGSSHRNMPGTETLLALTMVAGDAFGGKDHSMMIVSAGVQAFLMIIKPGA